MFYNHLIKLNIIIIHYVVPFDADAWVAGCGGPHSGPWFAIVLSRFSPAP